MELIAERVISRVPRIRFLTPRDIGVVSPIKLTTYGHERNFTITTQARPRFLSPAPLPAARVRLLSDDQIYMDTQLRARSVACQRALSSYRKFRARIVINAGLRPVPTRSIHAVIIYNARIPFFNYPIHRYTPFDIE